MKGTTVVILVACIIYSVTSSSVIIKHLVKRGQGAIQGGGGSGLGGAASNAAAVNPGGVATANVGAGSIGAGGGGSVVLDTIFGGGSGTFGAGLGGGVGSSMATGAETASNVDTISSGTGEAAGLQVAGPIGK